MLDCALIGVCAVIRSNTVYVYAIFNRGSDQYISPRILVTVSCQRIERTVEFDWNTSKLIRIFRMYVTVSLALANSN